MRRVVSLWLPAWPTDRLRKQDAPPNGALPNGALPDGALPDGALVTATHDGRKRVIAAVDAIAAQSGLYPGMPVAQGQALVPDLTVMEARPEEDAAALRRLAGWCLRYAPLTAAAPPDGVWIDVTGSAHLQGGETRLLRDLVSRLLVQGFAAHAAVADTPGAAHAMARFGAQEITVIPPGVPWGGHEAALARLPLAALRLPDETLDGLRLMGIEQIGALAALPRAPLVRRFGALVTTRLDQAFGRASEAIEPEFPPELIQARLTFVEPLLTAEAFATVIDRLIATVCSAMERSGTGARRLDLLFERVDGTTQAIRIGTARASRDTRHLARLLKERIERVDPGLGVEAMRLVVPRADPLVPVQAAARLTATDVEEPDIAPLIDRLANRLGPERVYRAAPVDSDVPERSVRHMSAQDKTVGAWPADLPRPVRLLDPPQPVEAMALLPDHPPMAFTWRRVRHRVRRADGPERIAGEWWKRNGETRSVRDYFRVEDEAGHRYWLFRRGDGENGISGDMRWFLHGFF
jgi:protein ImuB